MFFEAILLRTAGFGALYNLLLSKVEGFREIHALKFEETSILLVARIHSTNGSGDEESKNFGAKFFKFHNSCFLRTVDSEAFCF